MQTAQTATFVGTDTTANGPVHRYDVGGTVYRLTRLEHPLHADEIIGPEGRPLQHGDPSDDRIRMAIADADWQRARAALPR